MTEWRSIHPEDGELLRFADGELSLCQVRRVRAHLARCWRCRASLDEIERTIRECVEYRRTVLENCLPDPPEPWFDIRGRMAALEAAGESEPFWKRLRRGWVPGRLTVPRLAVAAVLAAILWAQATLIFRNREPARSAPGNATPALLRSPSKGEPAPAPSSSRPAAPPATAAPRDTATASDELRVFALLRRLGADLGEPVEVTRQGGRVLVSGIGISPEVERELHRELEASPRFSVRFTPPAAPAPEQPRAPRVTVQPEVTRLQVELEERLGGRAAYDEFADGLLETTDELLAHSHALRRLAGRFPPEVEDELERGDRRLLASLRREHAAAVAKLAVALEERSRRVFASIAAADETGAAAPAPAESWQRAALDLLERARHAERLLAAILGGAASPAPAATLPAEFLRSLEQLRRQAEALRGEAAE